MKGHRLQKPDSRGYFGKFGGMFVPEVLVGAVAELERAMNDAFADPAFWREYEDVLRDFVGRPSPVYRAERLAGPNAAPLLFKREDLNHTGAHKINNTVGQALLARRMGKTRFIAETGAGQHGVATATVGAKLGVPVEVFMGAVDVERQALNVYMMKLLGATVHSVESGTRTLKDATNEAFRDWAGRVADTFYIIGSVVGAHPYPYMVREFQKVIGVEARAQVLERYGRLPERRHRMRRRRVERDGHLLGVRRRSGGEAVGRRSVRATAWRRSTPPRRSTPGRLASCTVPARTCCRHAEGQVQDTHSISAGLDYPRRGPGARVPQRFGPRDVRLGHR